MVLYLFINEGKGTLAPWNPTQKFIVTRPYKYVRNPMLSGVCYILLGEAIVLNSISICLWFIIFFSINTIYLIKVEEPQLLKKYGTKNSEYYEYVNRWLPKFKAYQSKNN